VLTGDGDVVEENCRLWRPAGRHLVSD
jgi:hypothetical protein